FLTEGNAVIDSAFSGAATVQPVSKSHNFKNARLSHGFFHQSALCLQKEFSLSCTEARNIIAACPDCAALPVLHTAGVNPRGLAAGQLFQSDVTIYPSFGRLKYVHVTVDMASKLLWASPL
ncbi:POK11 protein, partial [Heliornis fulica]|nr:POK11 protein [Heliornis fulica]